MVHGRAHTLFFTEHPVQKSQSGKNYKSVVLTLSYAREGGGEAGSKSPDYGYGPY